MKRAIDFHFFSKLLCFLIGALKTYFEVLKKKVCQSFDFIEAKIAWRDFRVSVQFLEGSDYPFNPPLRLWSSVMRSKSVF